MVLYFSATGNSKFVAERIAKSLDDEIINLFTKIKENDYSPIYSDKPWVFVCPVYVAMMPQMVEDYVRATPLHGNKDIYFIFTAAADMGISGYVEKQYMKEKGMNYCGSAGIKMPTNYPIFFTVKTEEECVEIIRSSLPKIDEIADIIKKGEIIPEKEVSKALIAVTKPTKALYYSKYMKADGFYTNGKCIGCQKCTKVCPMSNISMLKNWPQWGNNCTHCMACISNCPVEAIEYGKKTPGKRKYHFPKMEKILEVEK